MQDSKINLEHISIRTELRPGDIGYIIHLHGDLYKKEYNYGIEFEIYVAEGLTEFYRKYNSEYDRVWICEHKNKIIGFLLSEHRGDTAQFRYFIILPEYRGIGLGNKMMGLFLEHIKNKKYKSAYLWTTNELDTAAHLYKKYGFELTKEKESSAFGKFVIEQRYDLLLS
jgi:ribosomal protein S18 acetylase RimI-like enzyme